MRANSRIIDRCSIMRDGHLLEGVLVLGKRYAIKLLDNGEVYKTRYLAAKSEAAAREAFTEVERGYIAGGV